MPELRGEDAYEPHLDGQPLPGSSPQARKHLAPVVHCRWLEIAGPAQRFLAQELVHPAGRIVPIEAVKGRPEHDLGPPGDLARQPMLGKPSQYVLLAEPVQLPAWIQPGAEIEHFLVEERVARLD